MSEQCEHNCASCGEQCPSRTAPQSMIEPLNELSRVGKVIGVVSGKGGVGKSLVTSLLAVSLQREGYQSAILDADITGPSIPKAFGIKEKAAGDEHGIFPVKSKTGIDIMSVNLLLENDTDPVVWRGPMIAGMVKQFWTDVIWHDVDYMFVDMPPGTGDVPLTVFQSLPLDGIIVVASPQELVGMIVEKAVKMANMMDIPIVGLVENMSYVSCPDCGKEIKVFGESNIDAIGKAFDLPVLGKLPIDPKLASACDAGVIELFKGEWLRDAVQAVIDLAPAKERALKIAVTEENGQVFQHFGKCQSFKLYQTQSGAILSSQLLDTSDSGHEALAQVLKDHDVDLLICGGIGEGAKQALAAAGITLVAGAKGDVDEMVKAYLTGRFTGSDAANCDHHEHEHGADCGGACGGCH